MQTLVDAIRPTSVSRDARIRDALLIVAGSLLVAACSKIQVPIGPVPATMQPFAVLLVGAALGRWRGCLALVAYLIEGFAGLPVFALPAAGPAYLLGPTGGYLLAFPVAAYLVGALAERGWDRHFASAAAAMALGQLVILAIGFMWMSVHVGVQLAWVTAVVPVLLADVLKIVMAALALPAAWRMVERASSLPH